MLSIKMRYSIKLRDRIYVKGYGFLSFYKLTQSVSFTNISVF